MAQRIVNIVWKGKINRNLGVIKLETIIRQFSISSIMGNMRSESSWNEGKENERSIRIHSDITDIANQMWNHYFSAPKKMCLILTNINLTIIYCALLHYQSLNLET